MEEKEINLEEIFTTLRRRKTTIFLITLIFILAAVFYNHHKRPVYKAMSRVRLPGSNSITVTTLQGITTPWNDVPTQLAILKSLNIRKRVIEKLRMAIRINDSLHRITIDSLEISPEIPAGYYTITVNRDSTYIIKNDSTGKIALSGKIGKWSKDKQLGLTILLRDNAHLPFTTKFRIRDVNSLLRSIGGKIKIQQEGNSFIAKIEARDYSPEFAKKLADAYAESYVDYTLEDARYSAKVLKDFLEAQVTRIEEQLKSKEDSLSVMEKEFDYFSTLMIKDGEETNKELLSRYLELISQEYEAKMKLEEANTLIETLISKLKMSKDSLIRGNNVDNVMYHLLELEKRRAYLILNYSSEHPEIKRIDKKIAAIRKELAHKIQANTSLTKEALSPKILSILYESQLNSIVYSAQLKAIEDVIKDYEGKLSKVPEISLRYFNLKRKIDALKQIYENLLLKLEETKIEHASQIPDARVLDYALVPRRPVSPNKVLNFYFALILGLFVGIVVALLQEHFDRSIKDPEVAERIMDAPILAVIPHIDGPSPIIEPLGNCRDEKLIEALNRLKVNLEFIKKTTPDLKTVGISSTASGEGKTVLALNLAQILTLSGYKTLLVNADLVKPTLNKILGISQSESGLTDFLYSGSEKANIIKTPLKGLDFLPSGENKSYISSYLFGEHVSDRFRQLTDNYDFVIFDTAPVGVVSNTLLFANYLFESLILAIKYKFTNSEFLSAVVKELVRNNVNIIGGVFNDFITTHGYGYKYYYYGYYYKDTRTGLKHGLKKIFSRGRRRRS